MESLYLLIPISLVVLGIAIAIFFWAVNSGQYEDMEREGDRILFDEDNRKRPTAETQDANPQATESQDEANHG